MPDKILKAYEKKTDLDIDSAGNWMVNNEY